MTALSKFSRLSIALFAIAVVAAPAAGRAQLPTGPIVAPELDLYNVPNWANSPLPTVVTLGTCSVNTTFTCIADSDCPVTAGVPETCNGLVVTGGIRKFVDQLPGLCPLGKSNLGQCLPVAVPDTTTYPGSDYYEIGLKDYTTQFHSDLAFPTRVRGYYQKNNVAGGLDPLGDAAQNHFLGPIIVANRDRPVRVLFVNELPTSAAGGNLFIPVDRDIPGVSASPVSLINPATGLPYEYSENRATLHLHGGNTQWISDGTQHQWTAAVNEFPGVDPVLDVLRKGIATAYVPDMWFDATTGATIPLCAGLTACPVANSTTNPGEGKMTFYWPNQQSGRLLFYHDHAYGITRLNVYAGEAAGYLLVDPADENVLAAAGVPGTLGAAFDVAHMLPLVIQDKTFVPPAAQLAATDPSWDSAKWGGEGSFWFPHVYTPNQWPGSPTLNGSNPMGRWDYGPWFWPMQTQLTKGSPTPFDVTVPCRTAAALVAGQPMTTACPITKNPSLVPESFLDTLVVNGTPYPTVTVDPVAYRFQVLNASQERHVNLSFFVADASGKDVRMVEAVPHWGQRNAVGAKGTAMPAVCAATAPISQVTGLPFGPDLPGVPYCWPTLWPTDARAGGVPNPADAGPAIVQIGSEGGILPAPAIIPAQPIDYEANKRNIVVLNVSSKALFMGSAERADVVVDFSQYAGKTLILYNDAPAPVPAGDPRNDYYTGNQDLTTSGGAPETVPGYGPNTRTIMQVVVRAAGASPTAWNQASLLTTETALTAIFKAKQPLPIVPEAAYSAVAGNALLNTYLPIQALNLSFTPVGTTTPVNVTFANKALHELFDTDYGRMDSVLGVEIPNTNWLNQTTIPFTNGDPTTEWITNDTPQIWKITHNGVDTHAIHFHLLNAQIVNRVGWDGAIRAPDANELGWKDTIRMNPLEDIIIALRPIKQNLPWPLPDSIRPIDVTTPVGSPSPLFSGVNAANVPYVPALKNSIQNFGQEYVWHCHLLGHEENDMLRAEVFIVPPEVPVPLTAAFVPDPTNVTPGSVSLTWMDNSASEFGFELQRGTDPAFTTPTSFDVPRATKADIVGYGTVVNYTDTNALVPGTTYYYRALAYKTFVDLAAPGGSASFTSRSAWTNTVAAYTTTPPAASVAPASLAFGNVPVATASAAQVVTLTNTGGSALDFTSIALSGASATQYAMVNSCVSPLAALASCTVSVTFNPTLVGAAPASLVFTTLAPVNPVQTVTITGTGTGPIASVSPLALAFGTNQVGKTTLAKTVTLSNTGNAALAIGSIAITGVDLASFAQTSTCVATLAAASSCVISVTFTAPSAGAKAADVVIVTNDLVNPTLTVPLSGTGAVSAVSVTPAALTFPVTLVQNVSAAQLVTLTNAGAWPLAITGVTVTGANPAFFPMVNGCGLSLAAGASCTVSLSFAPTSAGLFSAAVTIATDSLANPVVTVPLTGTGTAIALSTTSLAFGNVQLTRTSTGLNVTVANNGLTALTGLAITSSSPQFIFTTSCGTTLQAGRNCTITARFQPGAVGPQAGTLSIASSDPVNPVVVAVSGTGVAPIATLVAPATGTLAFTARVNRATSPTQVVTVKNTGTAPLTINNVNITNTRNFAIVGGTCGGNLAIGASCTVNVNFRARALGTVTGQLSVGVAAPATNLTVALTGVGTP